AGGTGSGSTDASWTEATGDGVAGFGTVIAAERVGRRPGEQNDKPDRLVGRVGWSTKDRIGLSPSSPARTAAWASKRLGSSRRTDIRWSSRAAPRARASRLLGASTRTASR